jgi:hypothetical protein
VETETALTAENAKNAEKKIIMKETTNDGSKGLNADARATSAPVLLVSVASISISLFLLLFSAFPATSAVNAFVVGV